MRLIDKMDECLIWIGVTSEKESEEIKNVKIRSILLDLDLDKLKLQSAAEFNEKKWRLLNQNLPTCWK